MSRPRILFLAPKAPYPLTSGMAMRQFHLIRAYSTMASVEMAFFCGNDGGLPLVSAGLAPYCERLHAFPFPPARRRGRLGRRHVVTHPRLADILESSELQRLVADSAGSADLIHVSRLHLAEAVQPLLNGQRRRPKLILDGDDVESVARRRHLRATPSRRWVNRIFHYYDLIGSRHMSAGQLAGSTAYSWLRDGSYDARSAERHRGAEQDRRADPDAHA